jgi:hypothetical protein
MPEGLQGKKPVGGSSVLNLSGRNCTGGVLNRLYSFVCSPPEIIDVPKDAKEKDLTLMPTG